MSGKRTVKYMKNTPCTIRIGYLVRHRYSSFLSWACMIFPLSNSHSSDAIWIIFKRTARCTTGIQPHTSPITRHLIPIWADVRYTRMIPLQKTAASTRTTQIRPISHIILFPENSIGSVTSRHITDALTDIRK